jgi:drug/metabolite transporter (DMT)-like permease
MPSGGHFTTASILAFISLGLIRGSFSVVIHFADLSYNSPSLVFLLRTPGTVALYVCLMIVLAFKDNELKQTFLANLRNVHNYWKSAVMGFLQLAAPYLLFMYGLKVMSPTAGGVFMAAAPWTTVLLERLPFIRVCTYSINSTFMYNVLGSVCG